MSCYYVLLSVCSVQWCAADADTFTFAEAAVESIKASSLVEMNGVGVNSSTIETTAALEASCFNATGPDPDMLIDFGGYADLSTLKIASCG